MPGWNVHLRLEIIFQLLVFHIADYADDLARDRFAVKLHLLAHTDGDALAQRIFIGPEAFGGRFVDDHNAGMVHVVSVCEVAAGEQSDSHRCEVTGCDLMSVGARFVSGLARTPIYAERAGAARTTERQTGDETG